MFLAILGNSVLFFIFNNNLLPAGTEEEPSGSLSRGMSEEGGLFLARGNGIKAVEEKEGLWMDGWAGKAGWMDGRERQVEMANV